ncbi:MAG: ATP-binding cassette domain-containing protein [Desulfurococcus sp.]|nr:ATP-binding cassette domain-containing protein [Desulfurococcus sp.]
MQQVVSKRSGVGVESASLKNMLHEKPLVSVRNISKVFPGGIVALNNISMDVYRGETLVILGENGAGKSTLVKILYGVYTPSEGELYVDSERVVFYKPLDAIRRGIVMVSQVPQLIDRLTVRENLAIALSALKANKLYSSSRIDSLVEEVSGKIGLKVDLDVEAWELTYTQKQAVEMLRAILLDARLVLIDEALTYIPLREKRGFYTMLEAFKRNGGSILVVTHKISEALEVADRIAVLKRGSLAGILSREEASVERIRKLMFNGGSIEAAGSDSTPSSVQSEQCISVENLTVVDRHGRTVVRNASLAVRRGEIAGIAGVSGSGQRELLRAIVGLEQAVEGRVVIDRLDVTNKGVGVVRRLGVGYIPDSPLRDGASLDNTILENIAVLFQKDSLRVKWDQARRLAARILEKYNVLASSVDVPLKTLSGGNIMKVIIGRELEYSRCALIAYNPTRALDEASAILVRRAIKEKARSRGVGVLLASEDLDELLQLSDTVYVMNTGVLYGPFNKESIDRNLIEHLMVS